MTEQPISFPLGGGLDLISPPGKMQPGRCIAALNYEPTGSGYQRLAGFERYDGRPAPSDASYWRVGFTDGGVGSGAAPAVGDTLYNGAADHFIVVSVITSTGVWATGNAAGFFIATTYQGTIASNDSLFNAPSAGFIVATAGNISEQYDFGPDGSELWPQPVFAASTGLSLVRCSIAGGVLDGNLNGLVWSAITTAPPPMAAYQVYAYSITLDANPLEDSLSLNIGNQSVNFGFPGTYSGEVTLSAGTSDLLRIINNDNEGTTPISACSVHQTRINESYLLAAVEVTRSKITAVTGSGPIRGIWGFNGDIFAFRDDAGATAGIPWKASTAGWVAVPNLTRLDFTIDTATQTMPVYSSKTTTNITNTASGASKGKLEAVVITSTVGTVNTGYLLISSYVAASWTGAGTGIWYATTTTRVGTSSAAASTTVTIPPGGRYFFLNRNFYGSADRAAMYMVNGVGKALVYNGVGYAAISTGMTNDTPTRLAAHRNALFLSFPGGSLQFSDIGEPLSFDPILGAGEIGVGSDITDLISANKTTLAIFAESSISALYGSDSSDYQLEVLAEADGDEAVALPYTAQRIGNVVYMDNVGIRSISATASYGNFNLGTLSRLIEPLLRDFRKDGVNPVATLTWKRKDQYWVFFDNGTALVLYLGLKEPQIMPLNLGFTVTCAETITIDAVERAFVGTSTGYVMELDKGTSFDGIEIEHYFRLPFNTFGSPEIEKRAHKVTLNLEAVGTTTLSVSVDFDYGSVVGLDAQEFQVTTGGGALDDLGSNEAYYASQIETQAEAYIDGVARNFSLKVSGSTATEQPHTATSVTYLLSQRGLHR